MVLWNCGFLKCIVKWCVKIDKIIFGVKIEFFSTTNVNALKTKMEVEVGLGTSLTSCPINNWMYKPLGEQ